MQSESGIVPDFEAGEDLQDEPKTYYELKSQPLKNRSVLRASVRVWTVIYKTAAAFGVEVIIKLLTFLSAVPKAGYDVGEASAGIYPELFPALTSAAELSPFGYPAGMKSVMQHLGVVLSISTSNISSQKCRQVPVFFFFCEMLFSLAHMDG